MLRWAATHVACEILRRLNQWLGVMTLCDNVEHLTFNELLLKRYVSGVPWWHSRLRSAIVTAAALITDVAGFDPWPGKLHMLQAWPKVLCLTLKIM